MSEQIRFVRADGAYANVLVPDDEAQWRAWGFAPEGESDEPEVVEPTADQAGSAPKRRGRPPNNPAHAG